MMPVVNLSSTPLLYLKWFLMAPIYPSWDNADWMGDFYIGDNLADFSSSKDDSWKPVNSDWRPVTTGVFLGIRLFNISISDLKEKMEHTLTNSRIIPNQKMQLIGLMKGMLLRSTTGMGQEEHHEIQQQEV